MLPPDPDPERSGRISRIGVELWQEDVWCEIIKAFDEGHPDEVRFDRLRNFEQAAASRYAATNPVLLKWFDRYNQAVAFEQRVRPFNFLLSFQAKSRMEMAATDPSALSLPAWNRRTPQPASRFSANLISDAPEVFDRRTSAPIPWSWLKTYGRTLARHHLHSESKFRGGADDRHGILARRHVHAWAALPIGKEADNLEERETLGENSDAAEWAIAHQARASLVASIEETLTVFRISDRALLGRAGVSHHTLRALRKGERVTQASLLNLVRAAEELRKETEQSADEQLKWLQVGRQLKDNVGGRNRLARLLAVSPSYLGRVLSGEKPMTSALIERLQAARLLRAGT